MFSWKPRCVQLQSEFLIVIFQGNILSQIYAVSFIPREDYTLEFQGSLSFHGGRLVLRRTLCPTSAHGFFVSRHKEADVARMICEETVSLQCEHHCTAKKVMEAFILETHSGYSTNLRTPQCRWPSPFVAYCSGSWWCHLGKFTFWHIHHQDLARRFVYFSSRRFDAMSESVNPGRAKSDEIARVLLQAQLSICCIFWFVTFLT